MAEKSNPLTQSGMDQFINGLLTSPHKPPPQKKGNAPNGAATTSSPARGPSIPSILGGATQSFVLHSLLYSAITTLSVMALNRLKKRTVIPLTVPVMQSLLSAAIFTAFVDGAIFCKRQDFRVYEINRIGFYKGTGIMLFGLASPFIMQHLAPKVITVPVKRIHTWGFSAISMVAAILLETKR